MIYNIIAVEERIKNFLPLIAKANTDLLSKIKSQGEETVRVDLDLLKNSSDEECEENDQDSDDDEMKKKKIKLEFMIGDFPDTVMSELGNNDIENDVHLES